MAALYQCLRTGAGRFCGCVMTLPGALLAWAAREAAMEVVAFWPGSELTVTRMVLKAVAILVMLVYEGRGLV